MTMTNTDAKIMREAGSEKVQFIGWIADRFQSRSAVPMPRDEALQYAADVLESFEDMDPVPFGHPDYDWSEDGAHTIADEEIHCGWESVS